jgi:hypothetical protein
MKLISCSRKKIIVHEAIYTAPLSMPASQLGPAILHEPATANPDAEGNGSAKCDNVNPTHVQSIKSVSAHTIPPPNTSGPSLFRKPSTIDASAETQSPNPGEGVVVPEHNAYDADLELGLAAMKDKVATRIADPCIRQRVINSLKIIDETLAGVKKKGALKVGKQSNGNVSASNVIDGKRTRQLRDVSIKEVQVQPKKKKVKSVGPFQLQVGDAVSAMAEIFDGDRPGSYSKKNPGKAFGVVVKTGFKKKVVQVKWSDDSKNLVKVDDLKLEKRKVDVMFIVSVLVMEVLKKPPDPNDKSLWPRDFFEALTMPDWREWILAVKKEITSWLAFNAYTEIRFGDRKPGSSIVPLGELYTRKRDGTFKFRQYLMGNLLRKGKDFEETFSSCISWDGIRWCMSIACAMGKKVRGLDAVTGFLQAKEQFNLYAFLPSHGKYSSLSFEELAVIRMKLMKLIEKEGDQGLKKFAAAHKRESRVNPTTCYQLNSSIYGAPSANHEWEMLFQDAHVNKCGLTLSEVEPSLFVKMKVDAEDNVVEWMIATIWTDDVRYFGTDKMLDEYEVEIQKHIKVKLLGTPGEFVGVDVKQDVERGLCEMKSAKYWEAAKEKFVKFFPDGVKERHNPMTPYDEKFMLEEVVSDEDFKEAKELPYRELCGVLSYAAGCTKLEMRYSVSVCGKHRGRWGLKQFKVMLKVFEYGFTTREIGLIYSKGLDKHGVNNMYCFADSGHSLPRSYGCTMPMMNGAALSLSAKKHTLTASSTMHDELIEFGIATNRIVGFRNMAHEMGFAQEKATTIYQDNEASIQVMVNRGSLSKQSRHIDRKILTSRNKIEDGEVMPKYIKTEDMLADIGTKALPDKQFIYLRDQMNGYALVKRHHPTYALPAYVDG